MEVNKIICGDCLKVMPNISDKSIDMILCDLPYGTGSQKWDIAISFKLLWKEYKRIIKDNGVVVLTASQPFTSALVMSNLEWFKYEWIWDRKIPLSSFSKYAPTKDHESILVFSNGRFTYNRQMVFRDADKVGFSKKKKEKFGNKLWQRTPSSIIRINAIQWNYLLHPTQKSVKLFEYLIKTYTNEGDLVLDNCAGVGTTGIACKNLKRNYILIEKENKYYEIAKDRIKAIPELLF